jgi:CBS domain-containing protein
MRAREIAEPYPLVTVDTEAIEAARLLAGRRLPGLIVLDRTGRPYAILPGSQVLRFMIPGYIQEDLSLAHVLDERHADRLSEALIGKTVQQLLPPRRDELPVVDGDATAVEIAAVMARWHSPLVAVVERDQLVGAVTVSQLLVLLLPRSVRPADEGPSRPVEPPTGRNPTDLGRADPGRGDVGPAEPGPTK